MTPRTSDSLCAQCLFPVVAHAVGLTTWLVVLYAFYIGFFAMLLKIALEVRQDNYMRKCIERQGVVLTCAGRVACSLCT